MSSPKNDHSPSQLVVLANKPDMKELVVANALIFVSNNFDMFKEYMLDGVTDPDIVHLYGMLTQDLFDLYVYPMIVEYAERHDSQSMTASLTAIPLMGSMDDMPEEIKAMMDRLLGNDGPPVRAYGGKKKKDD